MRSSSRCLAVVLWLGAVALAAPVAVEAQEWARFRGPNGSGVSATKQTLPVKWTADQVLWKTKLPGTGHSSPVAWGTKAFVTSADAKTGLRHVSCVNLANGEVVWKREAAGETYRTHQRNSIATSSPVVDAKQLYVCWATPAKLMAMAYTHEGEPVWQVELGPYKGNHGFGVSPIVHEDLLILPNDQDGGGSLLALDTKSGDVKWKTPRQGKNATYATPCVYQVGDRPAELIFTNWQHGITGIDPKTGQVNWESSVFEVAKNERSIASPVVAGDLIIGTCGFISAQKHHVAVRPGKTPGSKAEEVWRVEKAVAYMPTPLVKGDRMYLVSEVGVATCVETATGKVVWQERLSGNFAASPVCAGDHIYCVANNGDVLVLAASDKFAVLAENSLGEATQSTPAIVGDKLVFRTEGHLLAVGQGAAK